MTQDILTDNLRHAAEAPHPEERKQLSRDVSHYLSAVREFETDRIGQIQKHARLAWRLVAVFAIIAVLSVAAVICLTPLKTAVPYVIRVDNNTGAVDVATAIDNAKADYGQAVDKYFLAKFVRNRESYDWETIQSMNDTVKLMADGNVFEEYSRNINNKTTSPLYLLRDQNKVMVRVLSVSFIDKVAQVRFIKFVQRADGSDATEYAKSSWIATIAYDYNKKVSLESDRLINPLGFEVISYRVDAEKL
jgi:type IV secretion system protein VirB8